MKTTIKYLFISFVILLSSCVVERVRGSAIYFCNKSSHVVMLTNIEGYGEDFSEIVLLPNEIIMYGKMFGNTKERKMSYEDALHYAMHCDITKATITYDDNFSIESIKLPDERKIDNIKNYTPKQQKHKNYWRFTYTFTDEDYEYAKQFGENLYEIE